ncbi:MAG: hypothetical protein IJ752_04470 [Alphaproteobacteria bacterium]|nr:hypothetical protein [Alphaproteobacteria bacterium]
MRSAAVKKERESASILVKMYEKGQLGKFPEAENRLRAGLLFMKDFQMSVFSPRTTRNYDKLFIINGGRGNREADFRCDAADRYLRALKSVGAYSVYALHFLRDEQNVRSFIAKYPVLNHGSKRTYQMVYLALNKMLDLLAAFYDREKM